MHKIRQRFGQSRKDDAAAAQSPASTPAASLEQITTPSVKAQDSSTFVIAGNKGSTTPSNQAVGVDLTSEKRTYWARASQQLKQENPEAFNGLQVFLRNDANVTELSPESVRKTIANRMIDIEDRQWKIKWGAKNIPVRNVLDGVVKTLQAAKDLGSAAANLDPIHAGLPWAALCALLPVSDCH